MSESTARLERRIAEEQQAFARPLRSLVKRPAVTCKPELTVAEAAAAMRGQEVGSLVVIDAAARPIGIVTEHDIVGAIAVERSSHAVAQVMTPEPFALPGHARSIGMRRN